MEHEDLYCKQDTHQIKTNNPLFIPCSYTTHIIWGIVYHHNINLNTLEGTLLFSLNLIKNLKNADKNDKYNQSITLSFRLKTRYRYN